ncbi:hypothetical protein [Streptomyces sp. NPDC047014]|uniref:hypothetical protein n=1 Tax=Streptomyces sp. NPDC047014 TaxID=3155736 RepID=UPI00340C51B6
MGTLTDAVPIVAAAVAGLAAGRGRGAHVWRLLRETLRQREAARAGRELVDLVERLPPGSSLVVRQEPGGRRSLEVRTIKHAPPRSRRGAR